MKTITIGFSTPNKFKCGAWAIQKWINKPYSHVYLEWTDDQGRDIVFQAAHGCVHIMLKDNFLLHNNTVKEYKIELNDPEYQNLRDFCYFYSGTLYGYMDLVHTVVYDLSQRFHIRIIPENDNGFICSELVSLALSQVKRWKLQKPSHLMNPKDTEDLMIKMSK